MFTLQQAHVSIEPYIYGTPTGQYSRVPTETPYIVNRFVCFVLFCFYLLCFFHKSLFLMGCSCHFQTILTNNYMHIKYKAEYHIVYPIYIVILANSKQIYVPGSVIPTINILDNTSDTTCVELALIDT